MKKITLPLLVIVLLASCSSPRYAYNFDHYDYPTVKAEKSALVLTTETKSESAVELVQSDQQMLIASSSTEPMFNLASIEKDEAVKVAAQQFAALSKAEQKEVRKEMVKSVKEYKKAVKAGDHDKASEVAKAMDGNLWWAAIFGAIGIGLSILGLGWLGGISILIGVVFLIIYLVNHK